MKKKKKKRRQWFKLDVTCGLIYVFSVQVVVTIPLEIAYGARAAC